MEYLAVNVKHEYHYCYDVKKRGRCGPSFGGVTGVRCNPGLTDWMSVGWCNADNGWCGVTDAHRCAQPDQDMYDYNATTCFVLEPVAEETLVFDLRFLSSHWISGLVVLGVVLLHSTLAEWAVRA